ncbi:Histidine phosphatase superfamily [Trypanosoma melophagium]|uniref:Histidine phosphatase superfamily n=1 Tax=Trypanosoma melophagium TaxID=715481 RepID=UPI00351A7DF2|nr:Histidine phosphatase superfamily [Trypanosoma melophagium]
MSMENNKLRVNDQNNSTTLSRIVVVMRHGERRDGAVDAPPEVDPPLTEYGVSQVEKVAERLRIMMGTKRVKKILLLVSPFLRTIQTAQELQRCGIGSSTPLIIDNTLCEVYGPTRIKSGTPPLLPERVVKSGCGELPNWGESIEMASHRFVDSLNRNILRYPDKHLLFVTHGDAIGAILNSFYPMRTVYEAEYLSFIALRMGNINVNGAGNDCYELIGSNGVQWLLDGPESSKKESSVIEVNGISGSGHSKTSNTGDPHGVAIATCGYAHTDFSRYMVGEDALTPETDHVVNDDKLNLVDIILVVLTVVSQCFTFFTWSNRVDAAVYVTTVVIVELFLFIPKVCPSRFPFLTTISTSMNGYSKACESQSALLGYTRGNLSVMDILLKWCAIAVKALLIFVFSVAFAFIVNIFLKQSFNMLHSYKMFFTTITNALVYFFFWTFNILRGSHEVSRL